MNNANYVQNKLGKIMRARTKVFFSFQVSTVFLNPLQAINMMKAGRPEVLDTTSLRTLTTAGDTVSTPVLNKLREFLPGTSVYQSYGLSEASGAVSLFKPNETKDSLLLFHKPDSVGTPVPGLSYKV